MKQVHYRSAKEAQLSSISYLKAIEILIDDMGTAAAVDTPLQMAAALLQIGENILETWMRSKGKVPTLSTKEGFRLLALHRQGARGEPSFNACRETCRELVYYHNLITSEPTHPHAAVRSRLMIMVAKHLCLFVLGKMQVARLGEFCCASKPVRQGGG
jgi:hypothetical protein